VELEHLRYSRLISQLKAAAAEPRRLIGIEDNVARISVSVCVGFRGTVRWMVELSAGRYVYKSDRHNALRRTFSVATKPRRPVRLVYGWLHLTEPLQSRGFLCISSCASLNDWVSPAR
jgi:hypothetical protein